MPPGFSAASKTGRPDRPAPKPVIPAPSTITLLLACPDIGVDSIMTGNFHTGPFPVRGAACTIRRGNRVAALLLVCLERVSRSRCLSASNGFSKMVDRKRQPLFQGDFRLPSKQAAGARNVWTAHLGIVSRQGMETYRARTPCHFRNDSSDGNDFLFPGIAKINRIMNSPVFSLRVRNRGTQVSQQEADQAVDEITDVTKTSCLASIAVNSQFLPL